jgi:uncharacterized RmlC-like cupin family protein
MNTTDTHGAGPHTTSSARLVNHGRVLHLPDGARVEILTPPGPADELPCLLRGTVPGGGVVPLHSHPDPETFVGVDGQLDGLTRYRDGTAWVPVGAGDIFHVPGDVPHAWRNRATRPATTLILTTARMARFFADIAIPPSVAATPDREVVERFLETSRRYGHWNATPHENAAVGLRLP